MASFQLISIQWTLDTDDALCYNSGIIHSYLHVPPWFILACCSKITSVRAVKDG